MVQHQNICYFIIDEINSVFVPRTDQILTTCAVNHFHVSLCNNPNLSENVSCKKKKKQSFIIQNFSPPVNYSNYLLPPEEGKTAW